MKSQIYLGIIVMNTPEGNIITTAEHTMALMLSMSRNISQKSWSQLMYFGHNSKSKMSKFLILVQKNSHFLIKIALLYVKTLSYMSIGGRISILSRD